MKEIWEREILRCEFDGQVRTVWMKSPARTAGEKQTLSDTYFIRPAYCRLKNKRAVGYVTSYDGGREFYHDPEKYQELQTLSRETKRRSR